MKFYLSIEGGERGIPVFLVHKPNIGEHIVADETIYRVESIIHWSEPDEQLLNDRFVDTWLVVKKVVDSVGMTVNEKGQLI